MATKYGKGQRRNSAIFGAVLTAILLLTILFGVIAYVYGNAEEEELEKLHLQTKQVKDDLILQIESDHENLVTMSSFASKLYSDGGDYQLLFESFKPIGLFSFIGVLNPDNTFITKEGIYDLTGSLNFAEEVNREIYISGRVKSAANPEVEVLRSSSPIMYEGECVGILYGVIKPETIRDRYRELAESLEAQLFVFDKATGRLIVDSLDEKIDDINFLKTRKFTNHHSFETVMGADKGNFSIMSAYRPEELYMHYSTIYEFDWGIMMGRYESQVFQRTHILTRWLFYSFLLIVGVIALYILFIFKRERETNIATAQASKVRKLLLEVNQHQANLTEAVRGIMEFASARSAFFFDTDGEDHFKIKHELENLLLENEDRKYFASELLRYAAKHYNRVKTVVGFLSITTDSHLNRTNPELYKFFSEHNIKSVSFASVTDKNNHVSILGAINPSKSKSVRVLLEDVAVCFSIAIFNRKHLNMTEISATTDSLTGVLNRVSYKNDVVDFNNEQPEKFSCVYIDVNELHLRNNKYGHAAGDEMLVFIANALKEVFYRHYIYRMGGDEFLVFLKGVAQEDVDKLVRTFVPILEEKEYKVAIGTSYREKCKNCEKMVQEAEVRMYDAKAQYYQNKEKTSIAQSADCDYIQTKTGISEIDAVLSVLKEHYSGIYRVSLNTDYAHRILMPSYLNFKEEEGKFSKIFSEYVEQLVDPDFHRAVMSFLNYDAIKTQLINGEVPRITYKKINGESVILSVYSVEKNIDSDSDTLWVFAKD